MGKNSNIEIQDFLDFYDLLQRFLLKNLTAKKNYKMFPKAERISLLLEDPMHLQLYLKLMEDASAEHICKTETVFKH